MKKALFSKLILAFFLIALDAATKALALEWVPPLQSDGYPFGGIAGIELPSFSFSLNTVVNTGIACGLFPEFPDLLLAIRLAIIAALFAYLLCKSAKSAWPLWLIAAGALGNVIDMIAYGFVVDFLHFRFFDWSFPIFNLADSLITIGAVLLFLWPKTNSPCPEQ